MARLTKQRCLLDTSKGVAPPPLLTETQSGAKQGLLSLTGQLRSNNDILLNGGCGNSFCWISGSLYERVTVRGLAGSRRNLAPRFLYPLK